MKIARLFGIDIVVDWSWLLIAALLTTNVTAVFAAWHPAWGIARCLALACVAMILFFASLVAHELAHSLVATSLGMKVTSIRLFLFGGVSNIDREPPSALGEFAMAIVGPLVSLGIGASLTVLSFLLIPTADRMDPLRAMQNLDPATTLVAWLGPLNVGLGLFNLIPGFPLDGGRVLRALFWGVTKDLESATAWAARIGQIIGWSFVAAGVASFFGVRLVPFGQGPLDGLWLAFIGWFLASAAQQSFLSLRIHDALEGVRVSQLMRRAGPLLAPDTTVRALVDDYLVPSGENALVVVGDDGGPLGIVTAFDVAKIDRDAWPSTLVRDIMTPAREMIVTSPGEPILDAIEKLGDRRIEQLPVLVDGALAGMLDSTAARAVARACALVPSRPIVAGAARVICAGPQTARPRSPRVSPVSPAASGGTRIATLSPPCSSTSSSRPTSALTPTRRSPSPSASPKSSVRASRSSTRASRRPTRTWA